MKKKNNLLQNGSLHLFTQLYQLQLFNCLKTVHLHIPSACVGILDGCSAYSVQPIRLSSVYQLCMGQGPGTKEGQYNFVPMDHVQILLSTIFVFVPF